MQECLVDELVAPVLRQVDDRLGNVVVEEAQLLLAGGERLLGQLEIVDVVLGAVQAAHGAGRVEVRRDAAVQPAPVPLQRVADALVLDVLARLRALQDGPQERRHVGQHHLERRLAVDLVLRLAHRVRERLVHERVLEVAVEVGDGTGDVVGEGAHLRLLRLQRIADADVVLDVVHHDERAADAAADLAVGEQRDARPPRVAVELALAPLVRHGGARERALDVARELGERVGGQHVLERVPDHVVGRHAEQAAERLVREADLELPVDVEDRQAHAVRDEPQPVLALAGLELQALQVVDVAVGDEEPADVTLRAAVGVVVDPDPERRAAGGDELALVRRPLARQRGVDVGAVELEDVPAEDLDDLAAEDVDLALGEPVRERLVDEAVALVAIDVGDRHAKRVQLALRKREQRVALGRLADRVDRQIDAIQRARKGHNALFCCGKRRWPPARPPTSEPTAARAGLARGFPSRPVQARIAPERRHRLPRSAGNRRAAANSKMRRSACGPGVARPRRRMPAMRPARLQSTAPSSARRQGSPKAFIAAADRCCALDRMHVPCHRVSAPRSRARHAPTGPGTARPPGTSSNCACVPIRLPSSAHPCRARRGPRDPRRARSPNKHPENCMKAASIAIAVATLGCAATVGAQEIVLYENDNFNGQRYSANHSINDLGSVGFNDRASSVTIRGGSWQLCSDAYFRGQCVTLGQGEYPSLGAMGLNDRVSSLREIGWNSGGGGNNSGWAGGGSGRRRPCVDRAVRITGHDRSVLHAQPGDARPGRHRLQRPRDVGDRQLRIVAALRGRELREQLRGLRPRTARAAGRRWAPG